MPVEVYRNPDAQVNGSRRSSYRKTFDIYSLGIMLFEIADWRRFALVLYMDDTIDFSPNDM